MERNTLAGTEWDFSVEITVNDVRVGLVGPYRKLSVAREAIEGVKATLRHPHLAKCRFIKSWRTPR
jgi:rRNA processing protein Krr1/Pno1